MLLFGAWSSAPACRRASMVSSCTPGSRRSLGHRGEEVGAGQALSVSLGQFCLLFLVQALLVKAPGRGYKLQ